MLANLHRGSARRERLAVRLRGSLAGATGDRARERRGAGEEVREEVCAAFAGLPDGDRELLSLTGREGLSPAEIATVLGCSRSTVRVRLHRARRRFARRLAAAGADLEPYGLRALELAEGTNR